jgi:hypothetical protein
LDLEGAFSASVSTLSWSRPCFSIRLARRSGYFQMMKSGHFDENAH